MLDSLVRVSRRVGRFGFLRRNTTHKSRPRSLSASHSDWSFTTTPPQQATAPTDTLPLRRLHQTLGHMRSPEDPITLLSEPPWSPAAAQPKKPLLLQRQPECPPSRKEVDLPTTLFHQQPSAYSSTNDFTSSSHSLSKVLFIFPSQYLFAIGFVPLFSFR